jgi:membrane-bound lytic murein transglycosylase D
VQIPVAEPTIDTSVSEVQPESIQQEALAKEDADLEGDVAMDDYSLIIKEKESQPELVLNESASEVLEDTGEGLTVEELEELDRQRSPLFHIVEAGETLYAISKKYDISIDEIYRINQLSADDKIAIGQKIYLSDPFEGMNEADHENIESGNNSYITYSVKKGDTMYSISRKYAVRVEDLLEWNNKTDYSLREGEILRIKEQK